MNQGWPWLEGCCPGHGTRTTGPSSRLYFWTHRNFHGEIIHVTCLIHTERERGAGASSSLPGSLTHPSCPCVLPSLWCPGPPLPQQDTSATFLKLEAPVKRLAGVAPRPVTVRAGVPQGPQGAPDSPVPAPGMSCPIAGAAGRVRASEAAPSAGRFFLRFCTGVLTSLQACAPRSPSQ